MNAFIYPSQDIDIILIYDIYIPRVETKSSMPKKFTDSAGCWLEHLLFGHQFQVFLLASAADKHLHTHAYINY